MTATSLAPRSVLITGISGGLAQITYQLLRKRYPDVLVWGIDNRPCPQLRESKTFKMESMKYCQRNLERLFRHHSFDWVFHLGQFSYSLLDAPHQMSRKLEFSIIGTKQILDLCLSSGVKKFITLSTFHVYGALAHNPVYLSEDMPLRASLTHPNLRHVVDMDNVTTNWIWKHQNDIACILFRPCNIVGPRVNNTISRYLSYPRAPYPIDYSPMMQFIHEFDMANLIVYAGEKIPMGIYNVASQEIIALRRVLKIVGNHGIPAPFSLGKLLAALIKSPFLLIPDYLIDYLMHSCLLDNTALNQHLPQNFFHFSTKDSLQALKLK